MNVSTVFGGLLFFFGFCIAYAAGMGSDLAVFFPALSALTQTGQYVVENAIAVGLMLIGPILTIDGALGN